jgi:two-component system OmpR family response regulator/two-component system torCAD operon response regulator TorR
LRIVVVEDEPLTRATLVSFLTRQGHQVRPASCVESCRAALRSEAADMVLLDIGLPGEDGLAYARELRQAGECGVIIVSERSEVATRIAALDEGADDYLIKPVHLEELAARVRSVARRRGVGDAVRIGPLTMDLAGRRVEAEGGEITLTRGEFDLLRSLAEADGKIVTREMLSEAVSRGEGDLRSVDALVSRLRRKLPAPPEGQLIVTAPGFGYRLGVPVRPA